MVFRKNFLATVLQLLTFISTTTSLPSISEAESAALEPRQGGYNTGIWIFTFYGYPDSYSAAIDCTSAANHNPPQGSNTIAYPGCVHLGNARGKYAGGDGSYNNPLTAAAYPGKVPIPKCGVFFSPYLRKFLIFEDYCPSCTEGTPHFDVWIGGGPGDKTLKGVCACENTLTPPSNRACSFWHFNGNAISDLDSSVNKANLWWPGSGTCNPGILNRYWQSQSGLNTRCGPS